MFDGPTGPDAPLLKRLRLPQGELAQFYDSDDGMRYMAVIELRQGMVRGNHYHLKKQEWAYLIEGNAELVVEDRESQTREVLVLQSGDGVVIEPGVAHAYRPLSPGRAIEFSPTRFEAGDTLRYPLI